jgi:hypothetical protein
MNVQIKKDTIRKEYLPQRKTVHREKQPNNFFAFSSPVLSVREASVVKNFYFAF